MRMDMLSSSAHGGVGSVWKLPYLSLAPGHRLDFRRSKVIPSCDPGCKVIPSCDPGCIIDKPP